MEDLIAKLKKVFDDGDDVILTYTRGEEKASFTLSEPPSLGRYLTVVNDSDKEFSIGYDELEKYFDNPSSAVKTTNKGDVTLSIKIEMGVENPAEEPDPLGEQLINKLKPIIREMMRGNYG